jgi:N4-gp56 family major capsid protein
MTHGDFDLYYSDEPFSIMDKNQRTWLDPDLIDLWRRNSVFKPLITFTKNLGDVRATSMTVTELLDPPADYTALNVRQIWMPSMHIDSRAIEITFQHYGNKIAYHKYDDMITYWKLNNQAGLRAIAKGALGHSEVDMNDMLARNAILMGALDSGYGYYAGGGTSLADLAVGDLFTPNMAMDVWLGMANRGVASALGASGAANSIICFTSPGVIYDVQNNAAWKTTKEYLGDESLLNYEVGSYKNVRFVQTPKCTLWNCGEIIAEATIDQPVYPGDGAPDPTTTKVDGTYKMGQTSAGIKHHIHLTATSGSLGSFLVNDIVTIHKTKTSDYGITNGVDFNEGTLINRRITAINGDEVTFDQPILFDYSEIVAADDYGYVTKARNVHASIFVGGPQALVAGVSQAPQFYQNDPIDDFKAVYRFSWDQYLGYSTFRPEVLEVVFSAGTTRMKGAAGVQ